MAIRFSGRTLIAERGWDLERPDAGAGASIWLPG